MNKLIINDITYDNIYYKDVSGSIIISNGIDDIQVSLILDYNKKEFELLSIGEEKNIQLNEIILSGYNESVTYSKLYSLVNPKITKIKKIDVNKYCLSFICSDKDSIVHMHEYFDIQYLELEITFDYEYV